MAWLWGFGRDCRAEEMVFWEAIYIKKKVLSAIAASVGSGKKPRGLEENEFITGLLVITGK